MEIPSYIPIEMVVSKFNYWKPLGDCQVVGVLDDQSTNGHVSTRHFRRNCRKNKWMSQLRPSSMLRFIETGMDSNPRLQSCSS